MNCQNQNWRGLKFPLLLLVLLVSFSATVARAEDTFSHAIVLARIVGPNQPDAETAQAAKVSNRAATFLVTIDIVGVKTEVGKELKGKKLQVRTTEFDEKLIDKTLPLQLTLKKLSDGSMEYLLICTHVYAAYLVAKSGPPAK